MRDATCPVTTDAELAVAALRYAAGEMPPADAEVFEARLGADQTARDALAEAVRLSAAASGVPVPTPDPLVRAAVAERVNPTWVSRLFPRRPYRGHPLAWAGVGGGIGVGLAVAVAVLSALDPAPLNPSGPPMKLAIMPPPPLPMSDMDFADHTPAGTTPGGWAATPATHPKLNPMGLDPQPGEALSQREPIPTPALTPAPGRVPPATVTKPMTGNLAEIPCEPDQKGEPAVGVNMSRL